MSLESILSEVGAGAFAESAAGFESVLRRDGAVITEEGVASALARLAQTPGDNCSKIEHFVEAVGNVQPLLSWSEVYQCLSRYLISDEEGSTWLKLLSAWQQAMTRVPEGLSLSRYVAPPLSMLPATNAKLLRSYAAFLVSHDGRCMSSLIPQTLFETSPVTTTLFDLAQILFTHHKMEVIEIHGLTLNSFLKHRFEPLNRDSNLFTVKLGVFLNEKLQALKQPVEQSNAILVDASSACLYCDTLLAYSEAMKGRPGNPFDDNRIAAHFERLRLMILEAFPEQARMSGVARKSFVKPEEPPQPAIPTPQQPTEPTGAEDNEDQIFAAFYRGEISSTQLVDFMYKISQYPSHTPESELLSKMLRTLFMECRHFPKYPAPELYRTADFFGKLIRSELLLKRAELHLLAIRCAMEALRKDPMTNIFKFGLVVLQGFLPIAPCSPAFLMALTKMPHIAELFPTLIWYAESCLQAMPAAMQNMSLVDASQLIQAIAPATLPSPQNVLIIPPPLFLVPQQAVDNRPVVAPAAPAAANPAAMPATAAAPPAGFGNLTMPDNSSQQNAAEVNLSGFGLGQVEALLEDSQITSWLTVPPEHVRNKVALVCNSISRSNLEVQAGDLLEMLQPEWMPWVAYYIVKARATKEINHLHLYADFAQALGGPKFIEMVTNVTYDSINVLMKYAVSAKEASCYKTVMKTLGSWLGLLTLARNKPLKARSFDVKHLLYNGYEAGTLNVILPLVCACLGNIKHSRIFKPPNPWTLSCLTTLASLYILPTCALNDHFEIELLMTALNLNLEQYIQAAQEQPNIFETLTPPNGTAVNPNVAAATAAAAAATAAAAAAAAAVPQPQAGSLPGGPRTQLLSALAKSARIPAGLALFQKHPELRIAVPIAMERAVKELVTVMSERAVILAVGTTVELVLKDFAMESEETLVKRAAHLMAAALAGSIVMITGRPGLRNSITSQFRSLIRSVPSVNLEGRPDFDSIVEHAAVVIAHENAHIASTLIEQVVIEQAVKAVQDALAQPLASRRAAAEKGETYMDPHYFGPGCEWPSKLPPALRLSPTLDSQQLEIYKAFAHVGPLKRVRDNTAAAGQQQQQQQQSDAQKSARAGSSTPGSNTAAGGVVPEALSTIGVSVGKLKEAVKAVMARPAEQNVLKYMVPPDSPSTIKLLATLSPDNEIFTEIENVVKIVQDCESKETVALCTARRLLRSIYDAAHRGLSFATEGDDVVEISYLYLEAFVGMLSRFDQLQLVHNLREVVTIWLISASYLAPGAAPPQQSKASVSYMTLSVEVAARSLIVFHCAAKYDMIEPQIIDSDFVATLLSQAWEGLVSLSSNTANPAVPAGVIGGAESLSLQMEHVLESIALTLEFSLHIAYILLVELRAPNAPPAMQETIAKLKRFHQCLQAGGCHVSENEVGGSNQTSSTTAEDLCTSWKEQPLKFKFSLRKAMAANDLDPTLGNALDQLFADITHPKEQPPRCLTLPDLIAYHHH